MGEKIIPFYSLPEQKPINAKQIEILHSLPQSENKPELKDIEHLRQSINKIAEENNTCPYKVIEEIRTRNNEANEIEIRKKYSEVIGYITDLHGVENDEEFYSKLEKLFEQKPDYLICLGDIVGSKDLDDLQKLFYNHLVNPAKEILKSNPANNDLLNYQGTKPPASNFNLKQGFTDIRTYELQLEGKSETEIQNYFQQLSDIEITNETKRYCQFIHYGHYASNLSDQAKQTMSENIEKNVQRLMEFTQKFENSGTQVIFIEGNWDARTPIDYQPKIDQVKPVKNSEKTFQVDKYIQEKYGFPFIKEINILETQTSLHILAPFDAIINSPNNTNETNYKILAEKVEKAKQDKKAIILIPHGQPNWEIHRLYQDNPQATGENAQIIDGISCLANIFKPDEIIYGHMHEKVVDKNGNYQGPDTKYLLQLIDNRLNLANKLDPHINCILASYLERRDVAFAKISKKDKKRQPYRLGGNRISVKTISLVN